MTEINSVLPNAMRAMLLRRQAPIEERPLCLETVPVPQPGPKELLVKVEACALCRTDLHVIEGDLPHPHLPLVPGHQIVGRVVERGGSCCQKAVGDRVGIAWLRHTCGSCAFCSAGSENLCETSEYTGYSANGGYAEYAVIEEDFAYKLPEEISAEQVTPLLCAGIIGYRALKRSALRPGQSLAIFGFGSSAHITIQIARFWGCNVFVYTRTKEQQALAKNLGASWVGDVHDGRGPKAQSAIVFAPSGELVPAALQAIQKGGTVSLAGIYMSDLPAMNYDENLFHEKTLTSVECNTRADGDEFLSLAFKIPVRANSRVVPLESLNEALLDLKQSRVSGSIVVRI